MHDNHDLLLTLQPNQKPHLNDGNVFPAELYTLHMTSSLLLVCLMTNTDVLHDGGSRACMSAAAHMCAYPRFISCILGVSPSWNKRLTASAHTGC